MSYGSALVAVVLISGCALAPPFLQNVHTVVPGEVYRSAQLSPARLTELIEEQQIRSVLNLRGASPGEPWYDDERAAAKTAGVEHRDFALSSKREVGPAEADELVRVMREAPKPMLIHCWAGADRTGLASALYLYAVENQSAEQASSALAMRYHHFSFTSAGAMDRSFSKFIDARPATVALTPGPQAQPAGQ